MATVLKNKGHSGASSSDAKDKIREAQVPGPVCLIATPRQAARPTALHLHCFCVKASDHSLGDSGRSGPRECKVAYLGRNAKAKRRFCNKQHTTLTTLCTHSLTTLRIVSVNLCRVWG